MIGSPRAYISRDKVGVQLQVQFKKCRKHFSAAPVFYISLVLLNARRVLSQCNTRLRLPCLLNKLLQGLTIIWNLHGTILGNLFLLMLEGLNPSSDSFSDDSQVLTSARR